MIRSIGGADYSYQYRLQPIVLIISPITRMADVSVQLYPVQGLLFDSRRRHTFSVTGLTAWNGLPVVLRLTTLFDRSGAGSAPQ